MSVNPLMFRNVSTSPDTPVAEWPHEVFRAIIEYGMIEDYRVIAGEVRRRPWGEAATTLSEVLDYVDQSAARELLSLVLEGARDDARRQERDEVAAHLVDLIGGSGLSRETFAARCGTSASRLSTYLNGKVEPRAGFVVRAEAVAAEARGEINR